MRKGVDITQVEKGQPHGAGGLPQPPAPPPQEAAAEARRGTAQRPGAEGLTLPPGLGDLRRGAGRTPDRAEPAGSSIASSIKRLEQRLQDGGPRGLPSGTVQEIGGLAFDPQGADFTQWINHFGAEAYRNWIVPEAVFLGFGGQCEFEFTVERDGTVSEVRLLRSAGPQKGGLDRAARNALLGSRLLPLPADYPSPRVTFRVVFSYGQGPQGS